MSTHLVLLAVLMLAVTYPWRAVPLLVPAIDRLPAWATTYLRLVGPAVLASLAAVTVLVDRDHGIHVGVPALSVVACVVIVTRRRPLLLGLTVAVALAALARAAGFG